MSLAEARRSIKAAAPRTPQAHLIETDRGHHIFVADGSRLFDAEPDFFARCEAAMARGQVDAVDEALRQAGLGGRPLIDDAPLAIPSDPGPFARHRAEVQS